MSKKSVFGISANICIPEMGCFADSQYTGVFSAYPQAICKAGAIPILLPPLKDENAINQQLDLIDLLIVSGGADVQPSLYGETPSLLLEKINPERDHFETQLIKLAYSRRIPIFGICRGLQLINVVFGGTLYQDVSERPNTFVKHRSSKNDLNHTHSIEILQPSKLYDIFKSTTITTNSYHHQCIKQLAPQFAVNAYAADGLIEGIEIKEGSFILAVQWHPEMMAIESLQMLELFRYLNGIASGGENGK